MLRRYLKNMHQGYYKYEQNLRLKFLFCMIHAENFLFQMPNMYP